eukprot:2434139-Amphidinium_carterae.1
MFRGRSAETGNNEKLYAHAHAHAHTHTHTHTPGGLACNAAGNSTRVTRLGSAMRVELKSCVSEVDNINRHACGASTSVCFHLLSTLPPAHKGFTCT